MTIAATVHAGDRTDDVVFRPTFRQLAGAFTAFVAVTAIASFSMPNAPAKYQLLMALLAIWCLVDPLRLARSSVTVGDRILEIRGLLTTVIVDLTALSEAVVVPRVTRIVVRRRDGGWFMLPRWLGTPPAVLTEINRRLPPARS